MAYKHIGKNFTPPDVLAKVTGKAKFAEDFRAEGMLFCRLFTSPMPHARVKNVDLSQAMNAGGVAVAAFQKGQHGLPHFRRYRRRRVVIKVQDAIHNDHSRPACGTRIKGEDFLMLPKL